MIELDVSSVAKVSMNKIALVKNVHVDDWITKLGITASSDAEERPISQLKSNNITIT